MALATRPKPSIHHKKSRGQHHRQGKQYLRTYAPYLPLLLLVVIGIAINNFWTAHAKVLGAATNLTSNQLLQDTNLERSRNQEPDLALNAKLNAAAQAKANDMVGNDYWAHNSPSGKTPWSFVISSGYDYQAAGENLAFGFMNGDQILTGWMNSPEHRANILNRNYQDVGFGITTAENFQGKGKTTVVVAMYGQPAGEGLGVSAKVSGTSSAETTQPYKTVSRVQMLTGGSAPWSFTVLSALTLLCLAILVFRHGVAWHRLLIRGEAFVIRHKAIDAVFVSLLIIGFTLTRASGFIG